jgi:hypothetical protein
MCPRPIRYRSLAQEGSAPADEFTRPRLEELLTRELQTIAPTKAEIPSSLTNVICDYARHLRDAGVPAEQAVIALKRILQVVMVREVATDPLRVHDRTRQLITTCIEAYYGEP